jgi:hypothetical protein
MTAPKLTLHDQAAINLAGWLTCQVFDTDPNLDLVLHQLRRVLPDMTRDNARLSQLHRAIIAVLAAAGNRRGMDWMKARLDLSAALAPIFFWRAAQACDALWPQPEPDQQEPAHERA